jgi:PIN domain nuclease of toxin-antitoxin system
MIVLDTHAWLWWVSQPDLLGRAARRALRAARRIGVPAICCLEVALLEQRGRIRLDRATLDWLNEALATERTELLPLSPAVAVRASSLPAAFPGDRADRLIAATAIVESATLVTKDARILASGVVTAVWD